jgi:hypothetical protein
LPKEDVIVPLRHETPKLALRRTLQPEWH